MATSNSLDEVLSTDVDPSAVTAIVGSLETQLAASAKTAANQPVNGSANGGITNKEAVLVEGRTNGGKIGVKGPAVKSSAVVSGKVVCGVGGTGGSQQAPGGPGALQIGRSGSATQQGGREAALATTRGAAGVKPVYGAAPTPMTGAQGTQVVNGGVSGAGTGAAPQGSLQTQLALKGLTKVVTAAGSAGQTAVIMSKPGTVTAVPTTGTPGTVSLPQGMQIMTMRPGQPIKTAQGTIAPRMILNQTQVLSPAGIRPGQPGQITLGPLQGLPPGAQGHLLVKTENGQLQLLRVNTAATPGQLPANVTTTTTLQQAPNATTYRFQPPQAAGPVAVRSVMVTAAAPLPQQRPAIILQSQAGVCPPPKIHPLSALIPL